MQIERITLTNFRNFEAADFALTEPRTLIAGPNGAGKSTILDAIAWVLTGECRGVDGRGVGQKNLIRTGAAAAQVTLVMDGLTLTRSVDDSGARASAKPDAILARLGVTKPMLQAVLNGAAFFDLDHAAAKALLFGLLDVKVEPSDVPDLKLKAPIGLDDLRLRHDTVFAERAAAKKALASSVVPEPPKMADIQDGAVGDIDAIKARRAEQRQAARDAMGAWNTAKATRAARQDELDAADKALAQVGTLKARLESQRAMLADIEAAGRAIAAPPPSTQALSTASMQQQVRDLESLIARVKNHTPTGGCVLNAAIPCQTPAVEFTNHVKGLDRQVKDLGKSIKAAALEADAVAAYQAAKAENARQVAYTQGQIDKAEAAIAAAETGAARRKNLVEQIAGLDQALPNLEAAANAAMKADADAERRLLAATTYQEALKGHDAAVAARARLEAEVERLDALVTLLGPKGVQSTVLARSLDVFQTSINDALEAFGFELTFQVDPWSVVVNGRPYELLSAGEKLMVGAAFQQALAMVSGLEFVAIDASEVVVGARRAALTQMVMTSPVGQILIAMAKPETESMTEFEGLQVIQPHRDLVPNP